jgi:hypothetical protein
MDGTLRSIRKSTKEALLERVGAAFASVLQQQGVQDREIQKRIEDIRDGTR